MREAIDVTITGSTAAYTHVVRLREAAEAATEQGTGKVDGQAISLEGSWKSGNQCSMPGYRRPSLRAS